MATPTNLAITSNICASDLESRLDREAARQQEETPPPNFQIENPFQSYDYLCEVERAKWPPEDVEKIRGRIQEPGYWECEARHLHKTLFEEIIAQYSTHSRGTDADTWRKVCGAFKRRLLCLGISQNQMKSKRRTIDDQAYWKMEAETLHAHSELFEEYMIANYRGWDSEASSDGSWETQLRGLRSHSGRLRRPGRGAGIPVKPRGKQDRRNATAVGKPLRRSGRNVDKSKRAVNLRTSCRSGSSTTNE